MVHLDAVHNINISLVQQPLVAVFTGATSAIGEYIARALAKVHGKSGKGLRIYIVGRSQQKAEKNIADYRRICPVGDFRFIKADLRLLREVDDACADIIAQEAKETDGRIDMLYMTQGEVRFGGRFGVSCFLKRNNITDHARYR